MFILWFASGLPTFKLLLIEKNLYLLVLLEERKILKESIFVLVSKISLVDHYVIWASHFHGSILIHYVNQYMP